MSYNIDLEGKVALVTGSSRGIGRAMLQGLAEAGAHVVVSSRKQDACEKVAAEVRESTGRHVMAAACHMGDWDQIRALVDGVIGEFGRLDIVVNNAGINPTPPPVDGARIEVEYDLGLWRKVFSVNVEGPLRLSQLAAGVMREQGGGSIINVATVGAYSGSPGMAAYGASKAALLNLTRTLAWELAPWKIRVNAICPGPVETDLTSYAATHRPGWYEQTAAITAMNRFGQPEEFVGPVVYLASDASSYVTGEDHLVSGGLLRG